MGHVTCMVVWRVGHKTANGAIFNDIELPLTQISRSRHYLTPNTPETVRDTDIVAMEY